CCEQFLNPEEEHFFDFAERKNNYWNDRQGNFIIAGRVLTLLLTGWLVDRAEFIEAAKDAFLTLIREGICDALGDYTEWRDGIGHDSGKYFAMTAFVYDMAHHLLTDDERILMIRHMEENCELARKNASHASRFLDNNRGSKYLLGVGIMGNAFKDAETSEKDYLEKCAGHSSIWIEMGLRYCVGRDGTLMEGASYGTSHFVHLALAAHIFARCGQRDARRDVRFGRAGDFIVHEMVYSQGWVNNFNDCSNRPLFPAPYIAGVWADRPACLWVYDQMLNDPDHPMSPVNRECIPSDFSAVPWMLLWPDDKAVEAAPPDECGYPLARHFRDRGVVSMRSGWGPEDLHVSMISGEPVRTAHRQADHNQVTLYALGEQFLIDSGYHEEDPETGEQMDGKLAEAHNLVLVDGEGQSYFHTVDGWPMGHIESFVQGPSHAYTMGDCAEAANSRQTIHRAERHIHAVWARDFPQYVLWLDDFEADNDEHEYTLLLHTAEGNRFEWETDRITISGKQHSLDIQLVTTNPATIHLESFGRHPRLHVTQQGKRVRFLMLLIPRRNDPKLTKLNSRLEEDSVAAEAEFREGKALHTFDTSERPQVFTGEDVMTVKGPFLKRLDFRPKG
ncbi:MAG: heparinase II/III family protein, partial [Planctomycetota bacterium]|nr:heparinase II/III family protein [Planctomycetota bacterium]